MSKELQEKRAEAVKAIQALRDKIKAEARDFTAEEKTQWEKANSEYDAISRQIETLKRGEEIDKAQAEISERDEKLARELRGAVPEKPAEGKGVDDEVRSVAFQGWANFQSSGKITDEQRKACERIGLNPSQKELEIRLGRKAPTLRTLREMRDTDGLQAGTGNIGGYLVPQGFVNNLERAMLAYGPMLQVAEIMRTDSGNDIPWPTDNDTTEEGEFVDEAAQSTTDSATPFSSKTFKAYKLGSKIIKISSELLEDSAFNMQAVLAEKIGERLGRGMNAACTTGVGTTTVEGVVTGASGSGDAYCISTATAVTLAADDLITLCYSVDQAYRQNGAFMMNDAILQAIRKLKDSQNQYLWQPSFQAGEPERLLGYPVYSNNKMAATVTAAYKVALFGDLRKYKIRQVRSIRLKRMVERYADYDQEGFVGFIRFDGCVLDAGTHPIKVLKVTAGS